jgi:AcrR family transcriptional regulator
MFTLIHFREQCSSQFLNIVHNEAKVAKVSIDQDVSESATGQRRARLRDALVMAAERTITQQGLGSLRARALAEEVGCAVGAIYNVVEDLDDLVLLVNARTLAALERELIAADRADEPAEGPNAAIARLVRMALAYLDFAAAQTPRWRTLFEHRMPGGREVPAWYREQQQRLFAYVEELLLELQSDESRVRRALLARSLFSAVHGLVVLGLEEKLQAIPLPVLREQVRFVVTAIGRGMTAPGK